MSGRVMYDRSAKKLSYVPLVLSPLVEPCMGDREHDVQAVDQVSEHEHGVGVGIEVAANSNVAICHKGAGESNGL